MKWVFLFVVSGVTVFCTTLYFKLGAYKDVTIKEAALGGWPMIYKNHQGAYHKINATISEVEKWVISQGRECRRSFGEYLDDPKLVEEDRLQSRGGCILDKPFAKSISLPKGFATQSLKKGQYLTALFKGSPSIGPFKVYPKAKDWFAHHRIPFNGPSIEIYQIEGAASLTTQYLFPITNTNSYKSSKPKN